MSEDEDVIRMVAFVQTEAEVIKTDVRTIIPELSRETGGQIWKAGKIPNCI